MNSQPEQNLKEQNDHLQKELTQKTLELQRKDRELEIEAALEKVRSCSLAMHKSDEIQLVINAVFDQLESLKIQADTASIVMFTQNPDEMDQWIQNAERTYSARVIMQNYAGSVISKDMFEERKKGHGLFTRIYSKKEKNDFFDYYFVHSDLKYISDARKKFVLESDAYSISVANEKNVGVVLARYSDKLYPEHDNNILTQLARVFEQCYIRFLDLQKAEAQSREAQIELSLERVRAKTMAMHNSQDVGETVATMFGELVTLGVKTNRCGILIYSDTNDTEVWTAKSNSQGEASLIIGHLDLIIHPMLQNTRTAWKNKETFFSYELSGEDLINYYQAINNYPGYPTRFNMAALPAKEIHSDFYFPEGAVFAFTPEPISAETAFIFKRFAGVFGQTYRRFLDLQKAEAQAREAQIELSLERVRAKTMAMHNSQDVGETVAAMFDEVVKLGIETIRCGIGIMQETKEMEIWTAKPDEQGKVDLIIGRMDMTIHPLLQGAYKGWKNKQEFYTYVLTGDDLINYFNAINNYPGYPVKYDMTSLPSKIIHTEFFFTEGTLFAFALEKLSAEAEKIFKRFAAVFGQTYRRYLDLKKAEAQVRQAQIEAAMEKVRGRALAMQKPEELIEVAQLLRKEMGLLGVEELETSSIYIHDDASGKTECWYAIRDNQHPEKKLVSDHMDMQLQETWVGRQMLAFYHSDEKQTSIPMKGDNRKEWINYCAKQSEVLDGFYGENIPERTYHLNKFSGGYMGAASPGDISTESWELLQRATSVFSLAYTRFSDLQQAEAQAREAQIEAALERVRSKAMAMQKSDDLAQAVAIVFEQLDKLNLGTLRCGIAILNKEKRNAELWTTTKSDNDTIVHVSGDESMDIHPLLQGAFHAWLRQEDYSYVLTGEDLNDYYKALTGVNFRLPESQSLVSDTEGVKQYYYNAIFPLGGLFAFRETPFSEEAKVVLKRFADVFNLTYTRFNDLKQAEEQAREAQIEAALERVRSKAMAMHNSADLSSAASVVFTELRKLGIKPIRSGISLQTKETRKNLLYSATSSAENDNLSLIGWAMLDDHPVLKEIHDSWVRNEDYFPVLKGDLLKSYYEHIKSNFDVPAVQSEDYEQFGYFIAFSHGMFYGWAENPFTENEKNVLKRFASVVDLTFKRYFDLQKAETQAREATIEAALEKVRGKAMAMHTSNDVSATASMVFTELRKLGINPIRSGVGLLNKDTVKAQLFSATSSENGDSLSLIGWIILSGQPVLENIYKAWMEQEDYYPELTGEQLKIYYEHLLAGLSVKVPDWQSGQTQYGHFISFSVGCLYAWSDRRYDEAEIKILKRFGTIIDLTFRRYMELQTSEANAKDAVKQSALDRVRADIASMRTVADLDRITPLIWNELTILGLPFIRCGVFIMDDTQQLIHTFLSTPDGKAIAAFHLPYDTQGNFAEVVSRWRNKKVFVDHWGQVEITNMADTLVKQGAIATQQQYLNLLPEGGFYLHFLPFLQGMLYVGNLTMLSDDDLKLIQSVADAFSTAYARYEDFNKLESAKQQIEKTLVDLKQAQSQLVQSEKMASLGELTAGIAHEIQNPLNFVNNFSDVNIELVEELKSEWSIVNSEKAPGLIDELLNDIKANEEKINHHGKRADAIVKGMLQHSRTSTNQKEPTDINALADEYLRLSYHGLRAKDKSFNTTMKTDFDETIGKINIIPQDIGRVLLNLYNNAFYAVNEKIKSQTEKYEPVVSVSTKKSAGNIEIRVTDNGNGIPQKVVDKIFQPFFTTKPTGQGTGLGLSLSYDIVKAHGGEIKVETKDSEARPDDPVGRGSTFIIQLPIV